jgi:hypothetical protein
MCKLHAEKTGALALRRRPVIRVAAGARDIAELCGNE